MALTALVLAALLFGAVKALEHNTGTPVKPESTPQAQAQTPAPTELHPAMIIAAEQNGGQIIVRGMGMPGAQLNLFSAEKAVAGGRVNTEGGWVINIDDLLETTTPVILDLVMRAKGKEIRSEQQLIVAAVPSADENDSGTQFGPGQALILLAAPGASSRVLQSPYGGFPSRNGFELEAIDYDASGGVIFSGQSKIPGRVQIYAGGKIVGESHVDKTGRWSLIFGNIMPLGEYNITAELIPDQEEFELTRLTLPFQRTRPKTSSRQKQSGERVVLKVLEDYLLIRRSLFGGGLQYSLVYAPSALEEPSP